MSSIMTDTRTDSRKRFDRFNEDNPHVVLLLERIIKKYLDFGANRLGINHICEVARYEHTFTTRDTAPFQIGNNYRPHFADLLIERNPDWDRLIVRHERWAK